jgi:hypothetical protein
MQGRKAWNATGERDPATGRWILDLSKTKPAKTKKAAKRPIEQGAPASLSGKLPKLMARSFSDILEWDLEDKVDAKVGDW